MTAQILQEELAKEIGAIFKNDLFKNSAGEYSHMNIYEQNLPIRQDEDEPDPVPYIIVRVETGQIKGGAQPQEVSVTLLIGYFDDDTANNGHKGVLGIIQKIEERFMKNPMLANQFYFLNDEKHPFDWAMQDEESFPYFFGAVSMVFATAAIRREDKYT
nr:MAG TPA: tail completion protein [Caudoviricetes sp.]